MDKLTKQYTNNTLEEELREIICDQQKQINDLKATIRKLNYDVDLLTKTVTEEASVNHKLLLKISDLTSLKQS
jgi:hypothetical protein